MISLGRADDDVDDIGETAAATAALLHRVINLRRNDQLPTVLIEEFDDRILDVLVGDEIAATNQHPACPDTQRTEFLHKAKADIYCQQKYLSDILRQNIRSILNLIKNIEFSLV